MSETFDAEYVLPLRWDAGADLRELTAYLARLSRVMDITVVDGSSAAAFDAHHQAWAPWVRHVPPQPWPGRNGKVRGVVTGVRLARHPVVVIADDDVRYTTEALGRALDLLDGADLVVPQNVFSTWPWHARWDTGRQLVNRALGGDFPGTLVLRRSALPHGYDGDVLFENLELMVTVGATGGKVLRADDLFVDRLAPTASHFWSQRVRQAYDSLAQPGRLLAEAALLPAMLLSVRHPGRLAALAVAAVALGEVGRRRAGGASRFPPTAALWTPLWLAERAVCTWIALGLRLRGGLRYGDGRILRATSLGTGRLRPRWPARRAAPSAACGSAGTGTGSSWSSQR